MWVWWNAFESWRRLNWSNIHFASNEDELNWLILAFI
jgi:hypothetical protein